MKTKAIREKTKCTPEQARHLWEGIRYWQNDGVWADRCRMMALRVGEHEEYIIRMSEVKDHSKIPASVFWAYQAENELAKLKTKVEELKEERNDLRERLGKIQSAVNA